MARYARREVSCMTLTGKLCLCTFLKELFIYVLHYWSWSGWETMGQCLLLYPWWSSELVSSLSHYQRLIWKLSLKKGFEAIDSRKVLYARKFRNIEISGIWLSCNSNTHESWICYRTNLQAFRIFISHSFHIDSACYHLWIRTILRQMSSWLCIFWRWRFANYHKGSMPTK